MTDELAAAQTEVARTGEALAAAELAVTAAEVTLEDAETGGDPDEIEDAEAALATAVAERASAAGAAATAVAASDQARLDLRGVEVELVETRATSQFVTEVSLGRGFETEAQVEDHLVALRAADLDEYAVLVQDLAAACFVYVDEDEDPVADAPAATPATPVRAHASYTG